MSKEQLKAWQKLRNKSAYSYQTHDLSGDEFIKLIFQVNVLFYHLIFYAIGYEGLYTDVSELGFPIKQYQPLPRTK